MTNDQKHMNVTINGQQEQIPLNNPNIIEDVSEKENIKDTISSSKEEKSPILEEEKSAILEEPIAAYKRLHENFLKTKDNVYVSHSGKNIFRDHEKSISTETVNKKTVEAMIDLVESKGWNKIKISGTNDFMELVYKEAKKRGIEIVIDNAYKYDVLASKTSSDNLNQQDEESSKDIGGKLLRHGAAPFDFDKNNKTSYFAEIEKNDGTKQLFWGKLIEQAIMESEAAVGDKINLYRTSTEVVSTLDNDNNQISAKRNNWQVDVLDKNKEHINNIGKTPYEEPAISGILVDSGIAHKHFDERKDVSFYAIILDQNAEFQVIWSQSSKFKDSVYENMGKVVDLYPGQKGNAPILQEKEIKSNVDENLVNILRDQWIQLKDEYGENINIPEIATVKNVVKQSSTIKVNKNLNRENIDEKLQSQGYARKEKEINVGKVRLNERQ